MALLFCGCNEQLTGCVRHDHDCYEIVVMSSGECTTVCDDTPFLLNAHSVLLIPPHTAHENFSEGSFGDCFLQMDAIPFPLTKPTLLYDYSGDILRITRILNRIYLMHDKNYDRVVQSLLGSVFSFIETRMQARFRFPVSAELKGAIEKNIANCSFSINGFARQAGYSADYVRRCFKTDMGITPQEYLTKLRLDYAGDLLKRTAFYSIGEIAAICGYQDPYYFSRAFKKHFGRSPRAYRQEYKE